MPELPEVECLTNAVRATALGWTVSDVRFLRQDLRAPIPTKRFKALFTGQKLSEISRRSKYMLWKVDGQGYGIFHLGMSGNFLMRPTGEVQMKHTHAVFTLSRPRRKDVYLHFVDPRRFGIIDCCTLTELEDHKYFRELGPEPLSCENLADHLFTRSRRRKQPIKAFLMDAKNVVGVGNIYASEALFRAGIRPLKAAGKVNTSAYERLAQAVDETLTAAIAAGGTTFRDFRNADGNPGYFALRLNVYDRAGAACGQCGEKIRQVKLAGRSTFYCRRCQA